MPHQKLTQAVVDRLPFSDTTIWYHDQELAGFNLSVGQKSKTFYAAHEFKGRFLRIKIGRADVVRVNVARDLARNVLIPEMRSGVDPRSLYWSDHDDTRTEGAPEARTILQGIRMSDGKAEGVLRGRRRVDADRVTVGQVWEAYEQAHIANLIENKGTAQAARARKHKTEQRRYLGGAERYGSDGPCAATLEHPRGWWDRPITSITPEEVSKTWRTLQLQRGRRTAQQFMMAAKVLFQFAVASDAVPVTQSPVFVDEGSNGRGLPKGWQTLTAKEPERIDDLRAWWREVDKLDVVPKSALKLMLLTGLRPSEALSLTWDQVDLERRKIVFAMTKTTGAREVALSSWSVNQLKRLERFDGKRNFVFCGPTGGRLHELPNIKNKGRTWTPKQCRKEWRSSATEAGISFEHAELQIGHSVGAVQGRYIVSPDLSASVQTVADFIMHRVEGAV